MLQGQLRQMPLTPAAKLWCVYVSYLSTLVPFQILQRSTQSFVPKSQKQIVRFTILLGSSAAAYNSHSTLTNTGLSALHLKPEIDFFLNERLSAFGLGLGAFSLKRVTLDLP